MRARRVHRKASPTPAESLAIDEVTSLTWDKRAVFDKVLGDWAREHLAPPEPPPKYNRKHGNLDANNQVLRDWFCKHKVRLLSKDACQCDP